MDTDGMKIDSLRLEHGEPSPKGYRCMCTFTLQLTPEVKLYGLQLVQSPEGSMQVYAPPMRSGYRAWSFAPELREKITKLASEAMVSSMAWKAASLLPRAAKIL